MQNLPIIIDIVIKETLHYTSEKFSKKFIDHVS